MDFQIKTNQFEGPLDILLDLIEKKKLHISDVSLSVITEDYISYINSLEKDKMDENSWFLIIASTLILIKSKSLLPEIDLSQDEQQSIDDLQLRLKILQRIREIIPTLSKGYEKNYLFGKLPNQAEPMFVPPSSFSNQTILTFKEIIAKIISQLPKKDIKPEKSIEKAVSLEQVITRLTDAIERNIKLSFKNFSNSFEKKEKVGVIVSFLALLELVKNGIVKVYQNNDFEDIEIESSSITTPNYQ